MPGMNIYCTLTNSTNFVEWLTPSNDPNSLPVRGRSVVVKGGANVMRKRGLITPYGVKTEVSDEQYDFLLTLPEFNKMISDGWITCTKRSPDADVLAADMSARDGSAPIVPNDYAEGKAPTVASDVSDPPTTKKRAKPLPSTQQSASAFTTG